MSYIVLYICKKSFIKSKNNYTNIILGGSYELYLIGFPIQQAIVSINGGSMNVYLNFFITLIISIPLSIVIKDLSDKMIEKVRR